MFSRIWVDTSENLVGVVDTLANAVFRTAVPDVAQQAKGKGNIFRASMTPLTCSLKRLTITEQLCRQAIADTQALCVAIATLTTTP